MAAPVSTTLPRPEALRRDWSATGVTIDEVARRLADQRRPEPGRAPAMLAGVLNLVAHASAPGELTAMRAVIEQLADHQPSRAILVCDGGEGEGIDATLTTTFRDSGGHTCVAIELVVLVLRGEAHAGAASATAPLLRSDLPTFLWWPGPPEPGPGSPLERLARIADRVVTEAGRADDGADAARALAAWAPTVSAGVTDVAWASITGWRRLLAQKIDAAALEALRGGGATATISHTGSAPALDALLLAGWLANLIGPALMIEFNPRPGSEEGLLGFALEGPAPVRRVAVERIAGRDAADVRTVSPGAPDHRRVLPLPRPDRPHLLAGELELQRHDGPFERALNAAARVAGR